MADATIEQILGEYVAESLGLDAAPGNDELLAEKGFIASLQLLDLVDFIETRFKVVLRPADVIPGNLTTVAAIARTVRELGGA